MAWIALTCPQCSAPLPRLALWRSVKCPACGSLITKTESVVERATFRQALERAKQAALHPGATLLCAGQHYRLLERLGNGEGSEIHLARSTGVFPFLATLKLSHDAAAAARFTQEATALRELRTPLAGAASLYAARYFPEVISHGKVEGDGGRHALVLKHPHGYWGSLAALAERFPNGIDPRHAVWIWRRMLDALHFLHSLGWTHGDLRPEHVLVNGKDHTARLIDFASAHRHASTKDKVRDLQNSARIILALCGRTSSAPPELADLLEQTAEVDTFPTSDGALGLDALLKAAAYSAFGPPSFVPLHL